MINFFSKLGSCCRHRCPPPLLTDESHLVPIHTSGGYRRRVRRNRVHRYPESDWRPALSVIMEESVVQDHQGDNAHRKSHKKSSRKSRSTADIDCFSQWQDKRNPKPMIFVSPFSSSPCMF